MSGVIWAKRYIDTSLNIAFQDDPTPSWVVCCYYWEKPITERGDDKAIVSSRLKDVLVIEVNPTATQEDMRRLLDAYKFFKEGTFKPHRCIQHNLERLVNQKETELRFECDPK